MAKKRWVCPECEKGILAPGRLRKLDTRRYCLPCSANSTLLVERVCPALETAKAKKADARKAAVARAKAKEEAKHWTERESEIRKEYARLWRVVERVAGRKRKPVPLTISWRRSEWHPSTSGRAWYYGNTPERTHITVGYFCTRGRVSKVLLHEICHAFTPGDGHGGKFKSLLADAAYKAYPGLPSFKEGHSYRYDLDKAIAKSLEELRPEWFEKRNADKIRKPEPPGPHYHDPFEDKTCPTTGESVPEGVYWTVADIDNGRGPNRCLSCDPDSTFGLARLAEKRKGAG